MAAVIRTLFAASQRECRSRRSWLPLIVGLIAGGALSFCLMRDDGSDPVPAAPADREVGPPASFPTPLNQTRYVPPIRIGLRSDIPILGASAPVRDSAAQRRDGELS